MIKATGTVEQSEAVAVTIHLTMTVKEWYQLVEQIQPGPHNPSGWPSWKVAALINDTLNATLGQITRTSGVAI